jgi:hypothetical protein
LRCLLPSAATEGGAKVEVEEERREETRESSEAAFIFSSQIEI